MQFNETAHLQNKFTNNNLKLYSAAYLANEQVICVLRMVGKQVIENWTICGN